jgi:signal peptidase II
MSTAGIVVALDQLTKTLAVQHLSSRPVHVLGPLDLQLAFNPGVAFSLGRGLAPGVVVGGVAVVAVAFALLSRSAATVPMTVAVGAVLGGALGNLVDRIFRHDHGAVVDFVALHFWPTFNLADAAVVVGEIALVVLLFRRRA